LLETYVAVNLDPKAHPVLLASSTPKDAAAQVLARFVFARFR
jgi:hypothetical protein